MSRTELGCVQKSKVHPDQEGCTSEPEGRGMQYLCPTSNNIWFRKHGRDKDESFKLQRPQQSAETVARYQPQRQDYLSRNRKKTKVMEIQTPMGRQQPTRWTPRIVR